MLLFKIKKENKNDVPKKMWISYGITNFFAKNFAVSKLLSIFANRIMPIRASFLNPIGDIQSDSKAWLHLAFCGCG